MAVTFSLEPAAFAAAFADQLRRAGLVATPGQAGRFAAALRLVPPDTRARVYWTARAVFGTGPEHVEAFDAVFAGVLGGAADPAAQRGVDAPPATVRWPAAPLPWATRAPQSGGGARTSPVAEEPPDAPGRNVLLPIASAGERLRHTAFAELSEDELAQLRRWIARVVLIPPPRRSRRAAPYRSGRRLDLRRTLRDARRTAGEPLTLARSERRLRRRRLVLLCDVSGSMEPYTRAFLLLLQGAVAGTRAEAFVFATRLTRLTRQLTGRDADAALERSGAAAPDWAGGTRIGANLHTFVREHGNRARGAVVVVLSDGWERDDPEEVARQMARLRRLAHRVVWVNPRAAARGYAPLAAGMAAALPHVDAFVSGHSLAALDAVAEAVAGSHAPIRYSRGVGGTVGRRRA